MLVCIWLPLLCALLCLLCVWRVEKKLRGEIRYRPTTASQKAGDPAVCAECGCTVARFFFRGGKPMCANCDPKGFAGRTKNGVAHG